MAVCQQQRQSSRTKLAEQQWEQIFGVGTDTTTSVGSSVFTKRMIAASISQILYVRCLLSHDGFKKRRLDDIPLRVLNTESSSSLKTIRYLSGCFHAIERKFLRELLLLVYEDPKQPDVVSEVYSFRMAYSGDETTISVESTLNGTGPEAVKSKKTFSTKGGSTPAEIRKNTLRLLRTLNTSCSLMKSLPDNAQFTIKLTYYPHTPMDYEPPGFMASETAYRFQQSAAPKLTIGSVNTSHHGVRLSIQSQYYESSDDEDENQTVAHSDTENDKTLTATNTNSVRNQNLLMSKLTIDSNDNDTDMVASSDPDPEPNDLSGTTVIGDTQPEPTSENVSPMGSAEMGAVSSTGVDSSMVSSQGSMETVLAEHAVNTVGVDVSVVKDKLKRQAEDRSRKLNNWWNRRSHEPPPLPESLLENHRKRCLQEINQVNTNTSVVTALPQPPEIDDAGSKSKRIKMSQVKRSLTNHMADSEHSDVNTTDVDGPFMKPKQPVTAVRSLRGRPKKVVRKAVGQKSLPFRVTRTATRDRQGSSCATVKDEPNGSDNHYSAATLDPMTFRNHDDIYEQF